MDHGQLPIVHGRIAKGVTMKPFLFTGILLFFVLSACVPSQTVPPTQTASPLPTETIMPSTFTPEPTGTPESVLTLQRGVNMGNMLEAPHEGDWGTYVQQEYFDIIKQAGFDFVRLPVSWDAHADGAAPYTIDPEFFFRVDQVLEWAIKQNLTVILDFHNYDDMMSNPWGNKDRFLAIWKQIAERSPTLQRPRVRRH